MTAKSLPGNNSLPGNKPPANPKPASNAKPLSDTQLVTLSAASQREDRGVTLPAHLKGGAAQKLVAKLIDLGLVEELRARGDLPIWRRDEDNRAMALRITKRGLQAIATEEDEPAVTPPKAPRGQRTRDVQPKESDQKRVSARIAIPGRTKHEVDRAPATRAPAARAGTKQAQVLALLQQPEGAAIETVMKATGWQPHTVRGFLSAVVRKKLGLTLATKKVDGQPVYRITSGSETAESAA